VACGNKKMTSLIALSFEYVAKEEESRVSNQEKLEAVCYRRLGLSILRRKKRTFSFLRGREKVPRGLGFLGCLGFYERGRVMNSIEGWLNGLYS
jgi:hypothetical protein